MPGRSGDGSGPGWLAREAGVASWLFRHHDQGGRMRDMGLGPIRGDTAASIAGPRTEAAGLLRVVRASGSPADDGAASRAPAGP